MAFIVTPRFTRSGPHSSRVRAARAASAPLPFYPGVSRRTRFPARLRACQDAPPAASVLPLTRDAVETVLDELRPYLIADGGNVSIVDIDGATVRLRLEGACGSCPSSTMTMKMGIERRLMERIPEIAAVTAEEESGEPLTAEGVEMVLDQVRPFLKIAGGSIQMDTLENVDGIQPRLVLRMGGGGSVIQSVKGEISSRLRKRFPRLAYVEFTS
ncbi:hypothetical protein CDCA_CDCA04G1295 [Cyanidium caldarium]|uniref:NIF system FeS cluster assembly NifU C-terminal domain-containing protein n=1 Tax=Cyanidium caldarium TaxID=2771 RepID=A0AAV9IT44_CYACA|nr:hypothetical protein CDCA_CDCA04G1295 [Cyanidium caldarium]